MSEIFPHRRGKDDTDKYHVFGGVEGTNTHGREEALVNLLILPISSRK